MGVVASFSVYMLSDTHKQVKLELVLKQWIKGINLTMKCRSDDETMTLHRNINRNSRDYFARRTQNFVWHLAPKYLIPN